MVNLGSIAKQSKAYAQHNKDFDNYNKDNKNGIDEKEMAQYLKDRYSEEGSDGISKEEKAFIATRIKDRRDDIGKDWFHRMDFIEIARLVDKAKTTDIVTTESLGYTEKTFDQFNKNKRAGSKNQLDEQEMEYFLKVRYGSTSDITSEEKKIIHDAIKQIRSDNKDKVSQDDFLEIMRLINKADKTKGNDLKDTDKDTDTDTDTDTAKDKIKEEILRRLLFTKYNTRDKDNEHLTEEELGEYLQDQYAKYSHITDAEKVYIAERIKDLRGNGDFDFKDFCVIVELIDKCNKEYKDNNEDKVDYVDRSLLKDVVCILSLFDNDTDGYLDENEMGSYLKVLRAVAPELTDADIRKISAEIKKLRANNNDKIDKDDLKKLLNDVIKPIIDSHDDEEEEDDNDDHDYGDFRSDFKKFDENKDDVLDREEMLKYRLERYKDNQDVTAEEKAYIATRIRDFRKDDKGLVLNDFKEIERLITKAEKRDDFVTRDILEDADESFDLFNTDDNHQLSEHEMLNYMNVRYNHKDSNISESERHDIHDAIKEIRAENDGELNLKHFSDIMKQINEADKH